MPLQGRRFWYFPVTDMYVTLALPRFMALFHQLSGTKGILLHMRGVLLYRKKHSVALRIFYLGCLQYGQFKDVGGSNWYKKDF
jgi:hypothetical protein